MQNTGSGRPNKGVEGRGLGPPRTWKYSQAIHYYFVHGSYLEYTECSYVVLPRISVSKIAHPRLAVFNRIDSLTVLEVARQSVAVHLNFNASTADSLLSYSDCLTPYTAVHYISVIASVVPQASPANTKIDICRLPCRRRRFGSRCCPRKCTVRLPSR